MNARYIGLALIGCLVAGAVWAEDPVHNELRTLRTEVVDAITKGDIDRVLVHLHPNVVVTWQNHEVCRGHQGVRDFFQRQGKQSFRGYKVPPTPDEMTVIYNGDTGLSFGTSVGQFDLFGKHFEFHNRWTAMLVKDNGRWLLAGYHVSWNALDNPLLNAAKHTLYGVAGGALVVGLLGGWLGGKRRRTKP